MMLNALATQRAFKYVGRRWLAAIRSESTTKLLPLHATTAKTANIPYREQFRMSTRRRASQISIPATPSDQLGCR